MNHPTLAVLYLFVCNGRLFLGVRHMLKSMKLGGTAVVVACSILGLEAGAAQSATINVNWTGTVVATGVAGTIDIGDTIIGSYNFDDTASVINSADNHDTYGTYHTSSFTVNGLTGSKSNQVMAVFNNLGGLEGDQIDTRGSDFFSPDPYTGDLIGGVGVSQLFVRFNDSSETVFSDASLPSSLNPADFDFLELSRLDGWGVSFRVTDFTFQPAPVPIPAALPLLGGALSLLGFIGWRRKRMAVA